MVGRTKAVASVAAAVSATVASAAPGAVGGAKAPERAVVRTAACVGQAAWECRAGGDLVIVADNAEFVSKVVFLGRSTRADDRTARARPRRSTEIVVRVPNGARSGALRLVSPGAGTTKTRRVSIASASSPGTAVADGAMVAGGRQRLVLAYRTASAAVVEAVEVATNAVVRRFPVAAGEGTVRWDGTTDGAAVPHGRYSLRLAPGADDAQAAQASASVEIRDAIFPIRAPHDLGQNATNDFGGARRHGGQDMFARCGAPLVAVRRSVVQFAGTHERAGNYVVLQDATGRSYVYMHMQSATPRRRGDVVRAGDGVGRVGDTGRATGCHLHFELWTAPGWYEGGVAVDPLPELRRWDDFD